MKCDSLWARHSFAGVDLERNGRLRWMMEELIIHASTKDRNLQSHAVLIVLCRYHDMGFLGTNHLDVVIASPSKAKCPQ